MKWLEKVEVVLLGGDNRGCVGWSNIVGGEFKQAFEKVLSVNGHERGKGGSKKKEEERSMEKVDGENGKRLEYDW